VAWDQLGNAVHGFLAADRPDLSSKERKELAKRLLQGWEVEGHLTPKSMMTAADRLTSWVTSTWPEAKWHREWPVTAEDENGTVLRGQADLLLETPDGWAVIDHKSFPGTGKTALKKAAEFAGQVGAYAVAVRHATQKPLLGAYIHLPFAGLLVPILSSAAE
jgi:ATP-dependent exoDNAse (exonuclease V) beta subunit